MKKKLVSVLPHYRKQEQAYANLAKDGLAGRFMYSDEQRELIDGLFVNCELANLFIVRHHLFRVQRA